jgi:hypothetical protein
VANAGHFPFETDVNAIAGSPDVAGLREYADLCRARHKSAYAEVRVMPTWLAESLVRVVGGFPVSA